MKAKKYTDLELLIIGYQVAAAAKKDLEYTAKYVQRDLIAQRDKDEEANAQFTRS